MGGFKVELIEGKKGGGGRLRKTRNMIAKVDKKNKNVEKNKKATTEK